MVEADDRYEHVCLRTATSFWQVFIRPALTSRPSALSRIIDRDLGQTTSPAFTESDLDDWVAFCQKRGKAVSKDVYSLLVPYIRAFDGNYENYDEDGEWGSWLWGWKMQ